MPHDFLERALRLFSDLDHKQWAAFGGAAVVTYAVYRRYARISLDDAPGPENPSFLHGMFFSDTRGFIICSLRAWANVITGHLPFLQDAEAGELENHYLTTYGSIVHWKGPLGVRETKNLSLPELS